MNSLNLKFLENYKRLDSLLKDMYKSERGVYEYIKDMEGIETSAVFVDDWFSNLKQLKKFKAIRNCLSHEVGSFEEELCSESDIRWLDDFRESLINQTDPLSLYEKHMETIKRKTVSEKAPQSPKASKFPAKVLLFAALTVISFIVIFSLVLIYFLFYK